jgi:hypothetical protein
LTPLFLLVHVRTVASVFCRGPPGTAFAPAGVLPFHAGGVTRNVPPSVPTVRELRLVAFA